MVRNILGTILAIVGAAAAVSSPYQAWYDGRHGSTYRFSEIFHHVTATRSSAYESMLIPFAAAALITLIGLLTRSRLLVGFAGLVVLGFAILWMVQQGRFSGELVISSKGTGLGQGVANALGGGLLLVIASVVMSGRSRRVYTAPAQPTQPVQQPYIGTSPQQFSYEPPPAVYDPPTVEQPVYGRQAYETPQADRYEQPTYEPPAAPSQEPVTETTEQSPPKA